MEGVYDWMAKLHGLVFVDGSGYMRGIIRYYAVLCNTTVYAVQPA